MFYVYFGKSLLNGKVYTDFTSKEPSLRIREHNFGSNQWSRANKPIKLVYFESYICKEDALAGESFLRGRSVKELKL